MDKLVSIIIPVYNVELYLERCVRSVMMQTYHNLEIILVDDGSPDQCGKICDNLAKEDYRIRVFHKTNGGLSDARNYGVAQSQGSYIAFVDSDDYIAPNYIEYLLELLIKHNTDISCCCMIHTSENSVEYEKNKMLPQEQVLNGKETCRELLGTLYHVLVTACGKLYKSEIVRKYPFPVGRKYEDEATTCKFYYEANKVVIGNCILYAYFQNPNSIMHSKNNEINYDAIWAQEHRAYFFEEQNESYLAQDSWDKVFYYCLYDSMYNQGRCNIILKKLKKDNKLSKRTKLELQLFNSSPCIFDKYLKLIIYPFGKARDRLKSICRRKVNYKLSEETTD